MWDEHILTRYRASERGPFAAGGNPPIRSRKKTLRRDAKGGPSRCERTTPDIREVVGRDQSFPPRLPVGPHPARRSAAPCWSDSPGVSPLPLSKRLVPVRYARDGG